MLESINSSVNIFSRRLKRRRFDGRLAQGDERFPDTEEVTSSNLVTPTIKIAGQG